MYIVRLWNGDEDVFVSVRPTLNPECRDFCVSFAWTDLKGDAVRFNSYWHAKAVAGALRRNGREAVLVKVRA